MRHPVEREILRRTILAGREALAPEKRRQKSLAVTARLWQLRAVREAATLLAYVNFRSEVETVPFMEQALARGKRLGAPLTLTREKRLQAYVVTAPALDLRPGYCGIPEPDPARTALLDPAGIDVVIVPGSVFDAQGGRLGYGGGYYDRFLAHDAPQAVRVGIAFEVQVVGEVPLLPHDQRLDWLVTEERTIRTARKGNDDAKNSRFQERPFSGT